MAGIVDKAVGISIGLLILFLFATTLILPQFSSSYRYCQGLEWKGAAGDVYTNCTARYQEEFNETEVAQRAAGATGSHTENGVTSPVDDDAINVTSYCLNCETAGGYRTANQGLNLLILTLALVGFALIFLPKRKL